MPETKTAKSTAKTSAKSPAAKAKSKGAKAKTAAGSAGKAPAKKPAKAKSKAKSKTKAASGGGTKPSTSKAPPRPEKRDLTDPAVRAKLKERNLKRFEESAPNLYRIATQHKPMSKLVIDDDGQPDVIFEGQSFYDGRHDEYVAEQLEAFWNRPTRMRLAPLQPSNFDDIAGVFLDNVLREAMDEDLTFNMGPSSDQSYFLYILGLGLGAHIPELVERTECRALAVVDPNPELLVHSLEVFDWTWLMDVMDSRGGTLTTFFNNNPVPLSFDLRNWLRGTNPMGVDGSTCYYHYNNPVFTAAMDRLTEDRDLILTGLGFFYDETLMLKHTHHALYSGTERVWVVPKNQRLDVPVFVIGNGPSLDHDLEFLRENQHKAVIISSGSALRPLVRAGVMPDFQMETENIDVFPLIDQVAKDHDISKVKLVTSTTVDLDVPPFFDTVLYYFRGSLSPFPIFCNANDRTLSNPNPTVVNASLSFAQELGFRNFYFFGTDLGTVMGADKHHSKDAYHFTEGAINKRVWVYNIPVPANFGGTCLASDGMYWTRDAAEKAIREFSRGRRYHNCANGARIEGAIPTPSKLVELPELPDGKEPIIEQIVDCFPVYDREEFDSHWDDDHMQTTFNEWLDRFEKIVLDRDDFDDLGYMTTLMRLMNPGANTPPLEWGSAMLYRGTFFQILMSFEYYLRRLPKKQVRKFEKIAKAELKKVLKDIRKRTKDEFGSLSKDAAPRREAAEAPAE